MRIRASLIDVWVYIGFIICWLFVFSPALDARFGLVDDHEIFRFASPVQLSPQVGPPISLREMIGTIDTENGRVRTVFYTIRFAMVYLLGVNPFLWHVSFLLIGVLTGCLFYASLRILEVGILPSILGVGMVMFLPSISYVWIRLGAPENIGTAFLSLAFFAIAQSSRQTRLALWNALVVLSALAAALTKESFILMIPALIYARLLVSQHVSAQTFRKTLKANLGTVIPLSLVFVFTLWLLYVRVQIAGASSQGGSSFVLNAVFLSRLADLATDFIGQSAVYVPAILVGIVEVRRLRGTASGAREILSVSVFPLLVVIPQLLLYATRDYFDSRYWLPAMLGAVFINIFSLVWLSRRGSKLLYWGCVAWLAVWLIAFSRQTAFQVSWFRADTVALGRMLDDVTKRVGYQRAVVVVADPGIHYEAAVSLLYHIAQRERSDIPIYILLTPSESSNHSLTQTQTNALLKVYFAGHNALVDVAPAQIDAIILFSEQKSIPSSWSSALPAPPTRIEYTESVPTFSLKERRFTATNVGYAVLWLSANK